MESFVFNSFKQRLMESDISLSGTWYAYPVNSKFIDDYGDKLKYLKDTHDLRLFCPDSAVNLQFFDDGIGTNQHFYRTDMGSQYYTYTSMYETDVPSEPYYVTLNNIKAFNEENPGQEHLESLFLKQDGKFYRPISDSDPTPRGFYFIKTSEELLWCANKVNGTNFDNTINIVLGDNIGTNVMVKDANNNDVPLSKENIDEYFSKLKKIGYGIGTNPAQPFNGIFFGNGFKILNIDLICNNDINGLIGYLGYNGWISTIIIDGVNIVECKKTINIDHLVYEGTDVCVGILCGKNNGKIENIVVNGEIIFKDFIPSIYSTRNKTEDVNAVDNDNYPYYPDFYCYDSLGNIVPYIGYFNEGVFATYSGYNLKDDVFYLYWNTRPANNLTIKNIVESVTSPCEWYYWNGLGPDTSDYKIPGYFMYFTALPNRRNVLWYDANIITKTNDDLNSLKSPAISDIGLFGFNYKDPMTPQSMKGIANANYFNKSIKLNQQNRAAYYVSPLLGLNNNIINSVRVNAKLYTSGTFVGFMGGIAGKQCYGNLTDIISNVSALDICNETGSELFYKRNILENETYSFTKKSIKNISSLFGSCVVGNLHSLFLNSVNSYLTNYNNVVFPKNSNEPEYDDYYFLNRYGALAAIVEYNSTNISDIWHDNVQLNNIINKSIFITNSTFGYKEEKCSDSNTYDLLMPYELIDNDVYVNPTAKGKYMFGIASPLIAEIKPTYLSVPSIISTVYENGGHKLTQSEDEKTDFNTVGLFGVDQNFASNYVDGNFWSINMETDLPGVANSGLQIENTYCGIAGGVIDRLNVTAGENFDLNIQNIASKLISWNGCKVVKNYNKDLNSLTSITVPVAAAIEPATFVTSDDIDMKTGKITDENIIPSACGDLENIPDGAIAATKFRGVYDYAANKVVNTYPYFGSDIELDLVSAVEGDPILKTDLTQLKNTVISFSAKNQLYWNYKDFNFERSFFADRTNQPTPYRWLVNNVTDVVFNINSDAFKYQPFTDVPLTSLEQIQNYYGDIYVNTTKGRLDRFGKGDEVLDKIVIWDLNEFFEGGLYQPTKYFDFPALSGFVFINDNTKNEESTDERRYSVFVIPFNILPFDRKVEDMINPPYSFFEGFYVQCWRKKDGDNRKYENMLGEKPHPKTGKVYYPYKKRNYLIPEPDSIKVRLQKQYFIGYDDVGNALYTEPDVLPTLTTAYLTTQRWTLDDNGNPIFVERKDNGYPQWEPIPTTLEPSAAYTGYLPLIPSSYGNNCISYLNAVISANVSATPEEFYFINGEDDPTDESAMYVIKNYQCYGYPESNTARLTSRDKINSAVDPTYRLVMSAVELRNVPSAFWNWQTDFETYFSSAFYDNEEYVESEAVKHGIAPGYTQSLTGMEYLNAGKFNDLANPYDYEYSGINYCGGRSDAPPVWKYVGDGQAVEKIPDSWTATDTSGKFHTNLLPSNNVNGLIPTTEDRSIFDPSTFSSVLFNNLDITAKEKIENNIELASQDAAHGTNYFKYTYTKKPGEKIEKIELPVQFDYKNGKRGFWYNAGIVTSGDYEYNDKVNYYGNILAIGKTLSQHSILNKCLTTTEMSWTVSGFSADDFEGLYITDSAHKPVMYIDVGLGECSDGTSWSFSSYPSVNSADYITETDPEAAYINAMNTNCSGLLLEIE